MDTWEGPEPKPKRRKMRKVTMVDSEEEKSVAESDVSDRIRAPEILEDYDEEVRLFEKKKRVSEDEIPLSQLCEHLRKQESNSEMRELPIKSRLRGATRAEPQE